MSNDNLRGEGLATAQRALIALAEDPQRLDDELMRFANSPPPLHSAPQSHNSTRSQSSDVPTEEQQRREERRWQLITERKASLPYYQFAAQIEEEEKWLVEADRNGTHPLPIGVNWYNLSYDNVKKRWVEQGIWSEKWTSTAIGLWKHQEPLELESEAEADDEEKCHSPLFPGFSDRLESKLTKPKSDEEKRLIAEQKFLQVREREASRPFHQFVYQLSFQRGRIQDLLGVEEAGTSVPTTADINSRAYERVKSFWVTQKIWDERWGIMPGMSWKHEEPFDEEAFNDPESPLVEGSHEESDAPATNIFGSIAPVESNPRQASRASSPFQPGLRTDVDIAGLENRRPNISQNVSSNGLSLSPSVDVVEPQSSVPPNRISPRRSKRIQRDTSARTASTNSSEHAFQSKPERKVAAKPKTRNSAKPQGVSKSQLTESTWGKGRKK